jgi:omega-amidase
MNTLKITLVQPELVWEDIGANLALMDSILSAAPQGGLIVLPEMFATGFTMNTGLFGPGSNKRVLDWLKDSARQHGSALMASCGFEEKGQYYNRLFCCSKTGHLLCQYDKRHLFGPGAENQYFSPGQERGFFEWEGWKIFPQICYDLRFPVWSRNNLGYDVLVNVANWPAKRETHWLALLKARAIENQAYTIGVNRVGTDGNGIAYTGASCIFDFEGNQLCHMGTSKNAFQTIELNLQVLHQYRETFNTLQDGDAFELK